MVTLGISNYLYKRSTDALGPVNATFFYYLFSLLPATLGWLALGEEGAHQCSRAGLAGAAGHRAVHQRLDLQPGGGAHRRLGGVDHPGT